MNQYQRTVPNIDLYIISTLYLHRTLQLQGVLISIVNKFNLTDIYWAFVYAKCNHFSPLQFDDRTSKIFPK